ncbi:CAP-Gly domain-containing protein [Cladophialophora immunda]|nr:CAP-Gly domain-containing protein [Cladophialophora immunda]
MADLNVKVGQRVETQDGKQGTVRYIGHIHVASGEWLGLELADDTGKNDGSVKGERYFNCAPGHGIFVRKESAKETESDERRFQYDYWLKVYEDIFSNQVPYEACPVFR